MITLITINIVCFIIFGVYFVISVYKNGKNIFSDISASYFLVIIFFPLLLILINYIYLTIKIPSMLYIGFYPLIIPTIYYSHQLLDTYFYKKKFIEFSKVKKDIIFFTSQYNLDINPEDIRIRVRPKNRIDIIVNLYTQNHLKLLERALNQSEQILNSNTQYKKFNINFYIDEKKSINTLLNLI